MTVPQPFQYQGSQRAQQKQKLKSETLKPEMKICRRALLRVAQPSPAAGSGTVPVRVSGTGGGTPLQPAGGTPAPLIAHDRSPSMNEPEQLMPLDGGYKHLKSFQWRNENKS